MKKFGKLKKDIFVIKENEKYTKLIQLLLFLHNDATLNIVLSSTGFVHCREFYMFPKHGNGTWYSFLLK